MNNIIDYLTSSEIIVVGIVTIFAIFLCILLFIIDKKCINKRKKQNTKELNKLVNEVDKKLKEEQIDNKKVVKESIKNTDYINDIPIVNENIVKKVDTNKTKKDTKVENNIKIDKRDIYEKEQEDTAIISLDELKKHGETLYKINETREFQDDKTAPISLIEFEKSINNHFESEEYNKPFIIDNIVKDIKEEEINEMYDDKKNMKYQMNIKDFNNLKDNSNKFHTSPIISPIYGIKQEEKLLDTKDLESIEEEIEKTKELVNSLKELQKNLD